MEEIHLEHRDVSLLDSKAILLNFLGELDHRKMVLLQRDVDAILNKFAPTLDIYTGSGSLTPAFEIFNNFRIAALNASDRALRRLDKPFDFSNDETFTIDRKDCNWPITTEEADILWEKRLKSEILSEALSLCKSEKKKAREKRDGHRAAEWSDKGSEEWAAKLSSEWANKCSDEYSDECSAEWAEDWAEDFGEIDKNSVERNLICEDDIMAAIPEAMKVVRRRQ
jgi:hypothetical protein